MSQVATTAIGDIPLVPIAEELGGHHRDDWELVVDELVTRMVRSLFDGATRLTDATLAAHVVVKVVGNQERAGRSFDYARPFVSNVTGRPFPGWLSLWPGSTATLSCSMTPHWPRSKILTRHIVSAPKDWRRPSLVSFLSPATVTS